MKTYQLSTSGTFFKDLPLDFYPRPMLVRDVKKSNFCLLNGKWDFQIENIQNYHGERISNITFNKEIIVPYCVESVLSGIHEHLDKLSVMIYQKKFNYHNSLDRVILHFDGVDNICYVYLNGEFIGEHTGGYLPFSFDVTESLKEENILEVYVEDGLDLNYPHGKQSDNPKGIWYEQVSGIWKSVWLESIPASAIEELDFTPDIDRKCVEVSVLQSPSTKKELIISFQGNEVMRTITEDNTFTIFFDDIKLWSPEHPNLYDVKLITPKEEITSYFAFRKISIGTHHGHEVLFLNNEPYFMHGLLDQGYFPEGLYTPSSIEDYKNDILTAKSLGFNTIRKHIKVEQDIWYSLCDHLGMLVWQDAVNAFPYRFFQDSLLPMLGFKNVLPEKKYEEKYKTFFINHTIEMIEHLKKYSCIVLWTIFNEGWGQFDTENVARLIRKVDSSRIYDFCSGWFKDFPDRMLESNHVYFKRVHIRKKLKKPIILSEFGGYSLKIKDHCYSDESFGYRKFKTIEAYNKAFKKLFEEDIIKNIPKGLCASIYTELTDVETEENGIMTYDRKVVKLDKDIALSIAEKLKF